jgi:murein hydrolase activator
VETARSRADKDDMADHGSQADPRRLGRRLKIGTMAMAVVAGVIVAGGGVGAQEARPPASLPAAQVAEALARHRDLSARIAGLEQETHALDRQSASLLQAVRRLEVERDLQQARAEQARVSLGVIGRDLQALEHELAALQARQAAETPIVADRLRRLQRMGQVGYARVVWGASSARDLGRAARLMTRLGREDARRLQRHRETTAELSATEGRLRERRAEAVDLREASERQVLAAQRAADERRALLSSISAQRDQQAQYLLELQRARAALDGTVSAYRPAASAPLPAGLVADLRQRLPWPVRGQIRERFGRQRDARFGTTVQRHGVDIASDTGAIARAVHPGTVAYAAVFEGFGQLVIIDHGAQAFSLYGYLSAMHVERGDPVRAGDPVGHVGEAPAGGPVLYFELRVDGRPVDPLQWLQRP